jgi:ribose transport system permease protein
MPTDDLIHDVAPSAERNGSIEPPDARRAARASRVRAISFLEASTIPIVTIALILFFSFWPVTSQSFPTLANIQITLDAQAATFALALAVLFPILCGEYDFSIGSIAGLSAISAAAVLSSGAPLWMGVLVAVGVGLVVGVINGLIVTVARVDSLVATLGMMTIIAGVVTLVTGGKTITSGIPEALTGMPSRDVLGIPESFVIVLVVAILALLALTYLPFGRYIAAIGVNREAARLLGLRPSRKVFATFVISGMISGATGLLLLAANGSASPKAGPQLSIPAFAVVFLSVAAILPGRFNVWGILVAVIFLASLNSGLNLAGAGSSFTDIANGLALILGVALSVLFRRQRSAK